MDILPHFTISLKKNLLLFCEKLSYLAVKSNRRVQSFLKMLEKNCLTYYWHRIGFVGKDGVKPRLGWKYQTLHFGFWLYVNSLIKDLLERNKITNNSYTCHKENSRCWFHTRWTKNFNFLKFICLKHFIAVEFSNHTENYKNV